MNEYLFLEKSEFEKRTVAGLQWLKRSFDVNDGKGSSAYYTQLWKKYGWSLAYPETTGYIIETLLDYDAVFPELNLEEYAIKGADWITTLQLPDGALPGGLADSREPSVFNTGQMIIGLVRAYEKTNNVKYFETFSRAVYWLVNNLAKDGSWEIGAYKAGFVPSYYTRVIWPVLWANKHINDPAINEKMIFALKFYQDRLTENTSIRNWAFKEGQRAFTHTIAYTIRGFYESSVILNDQNINHMAISLADKVMRNRELKGKLAGWYDEKWNGSYWFTCLTGNCQMAIIFSRIFEQTKDPRYLNTALKVFGDVVDEQNMNSGVNKRGALPGSAPFHGRYLAFRYPNWATKFFLDAYLLLRQNVELIENMP